MGKKRYVYLGLLLTGLLIGFAVQTYAQTPLSLPANVLVAVEGGSVNIPENIQAIVLGGPKTITEQIISSARKKVGYSCRNAATIEGVKELKIPGIVGLVPVMSEKIDRTVSAYWDDYTVRGGTEITTYALYATAIRYLNPQIADLNRICKESIIRIPAVMDADATVSATPSTTLHSDEARIAQLENDLASVRSVVQSQGKLVALLPAMKNEIAVLRTQIQEKEETNADLRDLRARDSKQIFVYKVGVASLAILCIVALVTLAILVFVMRRRVVNVTPSNAEIAGDTDTKNTEHDSIVAQREEEELDYADVSRGYMKFVYHGEPLILKVHDVQAPCGQEVAVTNLASHRLKCARKACAVVNVATSTMVSFGSMLYEQRDGRKEIIKVVSVGAPCDTVLRLRNMVGHIDACISEECVKTRSASTSAVS